MRRGRHPRPYAEGAAAFASGAGWWTNRYGVRSAEFWLWCEGYDDARARAQRQ